jgi:hypothetical protein
VHKSRLFQQIDRLFAANSDDEQSWKRTIRGGALANALFSKPVSRKSAKKTMSQFLDRVQQVNSNS